MKKQIATVLGIIGLAIAPAASAQYRYFGPGQGGIPTPDPDKAVEYILEFTDGNFGVMGRSIVYCGGDEDFGGDITAYVEYQQITVCSSGDPENP